MAEILKEKKPETERLITRITPETQKQLEAICNRVDAVAPHLHFTVDDVVEKAVRSAIKKANKELDALEEPSVSADFGDGNKVEAFGSESATSNQS